MGCDDLEDCFVLVGEKRHCGHAGGVFWELARTMLNKGGFVVGAAYAEDFRVEHTLVDSEGDLEKLAGVKYAESHINGKVKKAIKEKLENGQEVLFSGTSCQIEEMGYYLGEEYDSFYTVTVKCNGVIRSSVWEDYIAETQAQGSVISEMYFPYRGKFGVSQNKVLVKFRHGTAYFRDEKEDKLFRLKKAGLVYKEECYQCPWLKKHASTDIFLEVYYENSSNDASQEKGLTKVSVYTKKGKNLLSFANLKIHLYGEDLRNQSGFGIIPMKPLKYEYFWDYYHCYGFSFAAGLILSQMNPFLQDTALLDFLKKCMMLDARGISVEQILDNWGLEKIILYGSGEVQQALTKKLEKSGRIHAVANPKVPERDSELSASLTMVEQIRHSDLPVLLGPDCLVFDAVKKLTEMGIDKKRILSFRFLVSQEYDEKILCGTSHTVWDGEKKGLGDIYVITGAQFANKGAQSMLFVTISELRKRYPDCDIYYVPNDAAKGYPDSLLRRYRFHIIRDGLGIYCQLYDLIPQIKAIIDISGYALASQWNCSYFIHILLLAQYNKIPIYLMPQSFGPFDFEEKWDKKIKEGLEHAEVIFAREKKGYDLLTQKYGLKNVKMSRDLVLQSKKLNFGYIETEEKRLQNYELKTDCNVAIVPNLRNYEFGNKKELLEMYGSIIDVLLKKGKNIYILSHSEDQQVCQDIYRMYSGSGQVFLYEKELDCLEYSVMAKEFQYMIAARYHAIVHAYKAGVPCIVMGWAEKYRELTYLFGQEEYLFDVRYGIDFGKLVEAVNQMDEAWGCEMEKIRNILPMLQTENCFDVIV